MPEEKKKRLFLLYNSGKSKGHKEINEMLKSVFDECKKQSKYTKDVNITNK